MGSSFTKKSVKVRKLLEESYEHQYSPAGPLQLDKLQNQDRVRVEDGKKMTQSSLQEIPQDQMLTLLATLTLSMLMSIEDQLPKHARAAREIRNAEDAVRRLAKLNAAPLDERLVQAGVAGWNAALATMQQRLIEEVNSYDEAC